MCYAPGMTRVSRGKKPIGATGPSEFNPGAFAHMCDLIRGGHSIASAAPKAHMNRRSVQRWLKAGREDPEGPYGQIARDIDLALAEFQGDGETRLYDLAKTDGKLMLAILTKRFPETYGTDKRQVEISGPGGGPIASRQVSPEEHAAYLRREVFGLAVSSEDETEGE